MKRNMKFLLMLAIFTSSIMAAYFITGCGDDSTVIEIPPPLTNDTTTIIEDKDMVVGSINGVVRNAYTNTALAGVQVKFVKNDAEFITTTDADGFYLFDDSLSSGNYILKFSLTAYTTYRHTVHIPTIEEIKGDIDDDPIGPTEVMVDQNAWLFPLSGTRVSGLVYTALPAPENKDQADPMALSPPDSVCRAEGVTVILMYDVCPPFDSVIYTTETDGSGFYEFLDVPLVIDGNAVTLVTLPFDQGIDSSFESTSWPVDMVPPPGVTHMPNIYAALAGSGESSEATDKPVILTYNFERPGFNVTDSLVINFSKPMDTASVRRAPIGFTDEFAYSWSGGDMVLTIYPALSLIPDLTYWVTIDGKSKDGLDLYQGPWIRPLYTQQGMRFVATNLDDHGLNFTDFPLNGSITLTFDMDVVLPTPGDPLTGWVVLKDDSFGREVNADVSASGATITINPAMNLESFTEYELDFKVFSPLRGDFVTDYEVRDADLIFRTENTAEIPPPPENFALDMDTPWYADWNTDSIDFRWDRSAGAEYYEIFAKDNMSNTDFIVVATITDVDYFTWMEGNVDFTEPANQQFDLFVNDGLLTPFCDMTEIDFRVRAVNSAGASGFSPLTITIGDETAPTFTVYQEGCADNTADTEEAMTFGIYVEGTFNDDLEYVDAISFEFVETGGDTDFVLVADDVVWDWANDMRNGYGVGTVAAGKCGAADMLIVSITDNSGNTGVDTLEGYLQPYLVITEPNATTTNFEAPWADIEWDDYDSDCGAFYDAEYVDLFFSWDGGVTWSDTVFDWEYYDAGDASWAVLDTVFSETAMIGLRNSNGGWIWTSDVFTHTGLMLTGPDEDWLADTAIYDAEGVDSTGIPLTFDFAGVDSVGIWYADVSPTKSAAPAWVLHDSIAVTGATGTYDFYPPDLGYDYMCMVMVADFDADARPQHVLAWDFPVINDYIDLEMPDGVLPVPGGEPYDVTWDTTVYAPHLTTGKVRVAYTIGLDTTWVVDSTANIGSYPWSVPANTPADGNATIQIWDKFGFNMLDETGFFTISGYVITAPTGVDEWLTGEANNIIWTTIDGPGTVDLWYSCDGFTADSGLIDLAQSSPYNWTTDNLPNMACSTASIRVWGNTHAAYATSEEFIMGGLVLTSPNGGENLAVNATHNITWDYVGSAIDFVQLHYWHDGDGQWNPIDFNVPNTGSYSWQIPNEPSSNTVRVKIARQGDGAAPDQSDNTFTIRGIIVTAPNVGEIWTRGNSYDITWTEISNIGTVKIQYSTDNGITWAVIPGAGSITLVPGDNGLGTFNWTIDPGETVSNVCWIRISEGPIPFDPTGIFDACDIPFEIQ